MKKTQRETHMLEVAARRHSLAEQARSTSFRRDIVRRENDNRREVRLLSGMMMFNVIVRCCV